MSQLHVNGCARFEAQIQPMEEKEATDNVRKRFLFPQRSNFNELAQVTQHSAEMMQCLFTLKQLQYRHIVLLKKISRKYVN